MTDKKDLIKLGDTLYIPPNIATSKTAAFGSNGSGKTYMVSKLNEELLKRGVWVIVLDPVGIHWGLRLDESGKKSSDIHIPIFGGQHGDVALPSGSGKAIADLLTDKRMSAVLDVSEFTDEELDEWCIAFANQFFVNMKKNPRAVLLELEEAQEFIPNVPESKMGVRKTNAFSRIAKIGRNYGVGILLVSPRPQDISTKVVNLTQTLFAFQMTGTHERKRIADWCNYVHLDFDLGKILPTLERGQPFVASPSYLKFTQTTRIGKKHTYDSSSTPEFDGKASDLVALSQIDVSKIEGALGTILEAEKQNDPQYLKSEILRLKRELERKPVQIVPQTEVKVVEKPVFQEDYLLGFSHVLEGIRQFGGGLSGEVTQIKEIQLAFETECKRIENLVIEMRSANAQTRTPQPIVSVRLEERRLPVIPASQRLFNSSVRDDMGLTDAQRKILNALAWLETIGQTQPVKKAVALLAGYSPNGGGFTGPLGKLKGAGLIQYTGDSRMSLTEEGRAYAEYPEKNLTSSEIQAQTLSVLDEAERRILQPLLQSYPASMTKEDLANAAGYSMKGGGFTGPLGRLRTMGIIDYPKTGEAIAASFLFL